MPRRPERLSSAFYRRPTLDVCRELLGKYLVHRTPDGICAARLVEVEAYIGEDDPASHAAPGKTTRNSIMYSAGGFVYVYKIYGVYYCLNFVTESEGYPAAVLIRAAEPAEGFDLMQRRSPNDDAVSILRGPGKLCRAFDLTRHHNGLNLAGDEVHVEDRHEQAPEIAASPRIGITKAVDRLWRFYDVQSRSVSGRRTGRANDLRRRTKPAARV